MKVWIAGAEPYDEPNEIKVETIEDIVKLLDKFKHPLIFNKIQSYNNYKTDAKYCFEVYDHYME